MYVYTGISEARFKVDRGAANAVSIFCNGEKSGTEIRREKKEILKEPVRFAFCFGIFAE